ncbi:hypothetical protein MMJ63_23450, partial [Bacillus vallismortis]|nr:hypothetical protein [Bacillus vallismortis]
YHKQPNNRCMKSRKLSAKKLLKNACKAYLKDIRNTKTGLGNLLKNVLNIKRQKKSSNKTKRQ